MVKIVIRTRSQVDGVDVLFKVVFLFGRNRVANGVLGVNG